MHHFIHTVSTYVVTHKKECLTGACLLVGAAVVVALFIYNHPPTIVYRPTNACDLLTPAKAQDVLGDKVINVNTSKIVVSGNIATSKCSYTDSNPVKDAMMVAAIAVRSGVNDDGVQQNKTDFGASRANNTGEIVQGVGDSAWFNHASGQLNVLSGRQWIIISYGVGTNPQGNTIDQAVTLAHRIL